MRWANEDYKLHCHHYEEPSFVVAEHSTRVRKLFTRIIKASSSYQNKPGWTNLISRALIGINRGEYTQQLSLNMIRNCLRGLPTFTNSETWTDSDSALKRGTRFSVDPWGLPTCFAKGTESSLKFYRRESRCSQENELQSRRMFVVYVRHLYLGYVKKKK